MPFSAVWDDGRSKLSCHYDWDRATYDRAIPEGWKFHQVVEVPEGDEDLATDLWRDMHDDFGANIAPWSFDPMADLFELEEDYSSIGGGDLLDRLQCTIDEKDSDRWAQINDPKTGISAAFRGQNITSPESFEEFAVLYAKWLLELRQEGMWELFYKDGTRTGPMDPSGLATKFLGEGDHAARIFNYHPVRHRLESELYRHFLAKLDGIYDRANALWKILQKEGLSATTKQYLAKVAECYFLDMPTQGAVMCRVVLEAAYKAVTEDEVLRKAGYCTRDLHITMNHREKYLKKKKIIRARREAFAKDVRMLGNEAAHGSQEPDLFPLVIKMSELLEALLPLEKTEIPPEPGLEPGMIKPGLCWVRAVHPD